MFKVTTIATLAASVGALNALPREHYESQFFEHIQKYDVKLKVRNLFSSLCILFQLL
jgi:hypothetical protein